MQTCVIEVFVRVSVLGAVVVAMDPFAVVVRMGWVRARCEIVDEWYAHSGTSRRSTRVLPFVGSNVICDVAVDEACVDRAGRIPQL